MLILFLAACASSPADDMAAYSALVRQHAPDPDRDLPSCKRLSDPNLAGDCALYVAQRGAARRRQPAETWCEEVPEGLWRSECWFQAAEAHRRLGHEGVAAELCRRSGPFLNDCAQHLWQTRVHRLIHTNGTAPDFAGKLPRVQEIYDEWAPFLEDTSDLSERFWTKYYQNGFEGAGRVDLGWCAPLPAEHQERCHEAARGLILRELAPNLDRNAAWDDFCGLASPTSEDVATWLRLVPSPALDPLVAERHAALCSAERR